MSTARLFCFGLGYSALALSRALLAEGWDIAGTCRSEERRSELAGLGIASWIFERGRPLPDAQAALARSTHLLISIPPDAEGDPTLDLHRRDFAACESIAWAGYLSTTGVYGDRGGGWVDEESALQPSGERGRRRASAEAGWLGLRRDEGLPVHIFRLAGIYGPGRSAFDSLREGRAQRIDKPGQVFSRIHVDDIVRVLRASMNRPRPGGIYNLCDDDPASPAEVIAYAAKLLGIAPPPLLPFAEARLSAMARSFYDDNKRVRNRRIKEELGVRLAFPDYRVGLAAILRQERER